MIFDNYGDLPIKWEPLPEPWQARFEDGVLTVDDAVPLSGLPEIITQVRHKLVGNDHLAPNCHPYRTCHLTLVPNLDDDPDPDDDQDQDTGRGVG